MVRVSYTGFSKAEAWDYAKEMAAFRWRVLDLAGKWSYNSPEGQRYRRIAEAIDNCGKEWGFSVSDLYAVGDSGGQTRKDVNPFRPPPPGAWLDR